MTAPSLQRVVYVVSLFPCWSETFIVREIQALIDAGVDVRVLSLKRPSESMVQPEAAALMDRVRHPASLLAALTACMRELLSHPRVVLGSLATVVSGHWRKPAVLAKSLVAWLRGLEQAAWLRRFDPQLVYSHWATYPSTVAWTLGQLLERPFGFTCHAHDIFVEDQLVARKLHDAALAVTISQFNTLWLREHGAHTDAALKVIHCGVDAANTPYVAGGREARTLLTVGRLDPIKGFSTLVSALALLKQRGVAFRCRLVGSGPLEHALRAQVMAHGLEHQIEFTGAQPQHQVREWMNEASVFVMPSEVAVDGNRDGIPVALMEAMATGCAVVSTRVSGIPELVEDGHSGLLVEQRDPLALADAIARLLDDAPLRAHLAQQARVQIERDFDVRTETRRLHAYMSEIAHAG
ncbi:MAG: glycosyltransferase family 4 protein [Pseudoxanthomonas sp.]